MEKVSLIESLTDDESKVKSRKRCFFTSLLYCLSVTFLLISLAVKYNTPAIHNVQKNALMNIKLIFTSPPSLVKLNGVSCKKAISLKYQVVSPPQLTINALAKYNTKTKNK
ncbi:MAG: hypothetical protein RMJ53_10850 [Chitinophagales bacterium]|nr:hypothetical protein [Chitinophagales bacterium]